MSNQEQSTLTMMRKVLPNIIKKITPKANYDYPLSQKTLDQTREYLGYIVRREKELTQCAPEIQLYYDTSPPSQKIKFKSIK